LNDLAFFLPDAAATEAFGEALGARLSGGAVLALVGPLGAGKTCLVRGLARGLGVDDPDAVASPTYLLVVEHPGAVPLLHMDAYLPGKLQGFLADGGLDYVLGHPGVVAVEWGDRLREALPAHAVWVFLEPAARPAGAAEVATEQEDAAVSSEPGVDGRRVRLQNAAAVADLSGLAARFGPIEPTT
jgi:tRNA threonylcarbamoyladenosine biosynthesis protein TsaE